MIYTDLPITDVCLNITEECNLACKYCFTEHHPNYMSLKVAKDSARWLYNNAIESSKIQGKEIIPNIGFFGGEPTLMWDSIIVPLISWIEEQGWKFTYGITSNCILMDKEKVDYLLEKNIGLLLSCDGDKYTQDLNRPMKNSSKSSFDELAKNLSYIAKKMPNITFRSTITAETAEHLFENLMFAGKMGFEHVFAIINEFEDYDESTRSKIDLELDKYCLYIIDACLKEQNFVKLRPFEQAINKIVAINEYYLFSENKNNQEIGPEEHSRCGLGNGYGSINFKGDVFSCQEVASRQGEKNIFYIGNIYDGIDKEKLKKLQDSFINRPIKSYNYEHPEKCNNCLSKMVCSANFCQVNNYILHKDFSAIPDCWCWWNNLLIQKAQFVMEVLGHHKNDFFKEYLLNEISSIGGPLYVNE